MIRELKLGMKPERPLMISLLYESERRKMMIKTRRDPILIRISLLHHDWA